jgi:hypothetical protein
MRAYLSIFALCGLVLAMGCNKKAEVPTVPVDAPKEVQKLGGTGGLPQPPSEK